VLVIGSWQMLLFQATAFLKNWGQALSTQQSIDNDFAVSPKQT
jgi:hypothetical protein